MMPSARSPAKNDFARTKLFWHEAPARSTRGECRNRIADARKRPLIRRDRGRERVSLFGPPNATDSVNPLCRASASRKRSGPTDLPSRRRCRSRSRLCRHRICRNCRAQMTSLRPPIRPQRRRQSRRRPLRRLVQTPLPAPESTRPQGPNLSHSSAWLFSLVLIRPIRDKSSANRGFPSGWWLTFQCLSLISPTWRSCSDARRVD